MQVPALAAQGLSQIALLQAGMRMSADGRKILALLAAAERLTVQLVEQAVQQGRMAAQLQ